MYQQTSINLTGYRSLGEAILVNNLSCAYYALSHHPIYKNTKKLRDAQESLNFIQNSGVYTIVNIFGLDIEPDILVDKFFLYVEMA